MEKIKSVEFVTHLKTNENPESFNPSFYIEIKMGDDRIVKMNCEDAELLLKQWLSTHGFNIVETSRGEWIEL